MSNDAALWDSLWKDSPGRIRQMVYSVHEEERGPVWLQMHAFLRQHLGAVAGLRVVEVGAGSGTYGAVFARHGAQVTVLDYSEKALEAARSLYASLGVDADFVLADALSLGEHLKGRFDVSMSFGLAEHFTDEERTRIVAAHFDLLRQGGVTFISVPNRHCWPYRLWKWRRTVSGTWNFGLELPYDRRELAAISRTLGVDRFSFFGSSFWGSLNFVLPLKRWRNSFVKRLRKDRWLNVDTIRQKTPGVLDAYLGYALVYAAQK